MAYPRDHFKACMQEAIGIDIISVDAKLKLKADVEQAVEKCNKKLSEKISEL